MEAIWQIPSYYCAQYVDHLHCVVSGLHSVESVDVVVNVVMDVVVNVVVNVTVRRDRGKECKSDK